MGSGNRRREIRARGLREAVAELVAQHARRHLLDLAFLDVAQLERPERHADETRDMQPEMAQHVRTSRFLPSRMANVIHTFEVCSRSSVASIGP